MSVSKAHANPLLLPLNKPLSRLLAKQWNMEYEELTSKLKAQAPDVKLRSVQYKTWVLKSPGSKT
jgi:hypothetical protein